MNTSDYRSYLDEAFIERKINKATLFKNKQRKEELIQLLQDHTTAKEIIQKAAIITQQHIAIHFSDIVTKALAAVFPDPYEFKIRFVQRRNVSECDLLLVRDNEEYKPLDSCGYGVADIASIALRFAYVLISGKRKLILFDEPGRFVSKDLMPYLARLIQHLSTELNIQVLIVTHSDILAECGNRQYRVTKYKGTSRIKQITI